MIKTATKERSKSFYMRITGDYALWTDPVTKGGGERISYQAPSAQAIQGICDAVYFKPTIKNIVDEVKVVKPIRFRSLGYRALYGDLSSGLNYVTVLEDVEYLVKYHFIWNLTREDLSQDRVMGKHEAIAERSLRKGGRRDAFLGVREFLGYIEMIDEAEYTEEKTAYWNKELDLGNVFHSFGYPAKKDESFESFFTRTVMTDGIVKYKPQHECEIRNKLSSYSFKKAKPVVGVDDELKEYSTRGERE